MRDSAWLASILVVVVGGCLGAGPQNRDAQPATACVPGQQIAWNDSAASSLNGIQMVDVVSTLNLVGTFDLEREQQEEAAAEEPPACPPPPVCPDCSPPAPEVVPEPEAETTEATTEEVPPAPATTTEPAPAPAP